MHRPVNKSTGKTMTPVTGGGENQRDASRVRDLRDWQEAVNKGYRNKAIEERLRK